MEDNSDTSSSTNTLHKPMTAIALNRQFKAY